MRSTTMRNLVSVFGLLGVAGFAPAPAFAGEAQAQSADSGTTEIVVTAQRREEKQRDVPISITAISSAQLTTANVQNMLDVPKLSAGLRMDYQGTFMQPTIRGIGTAVTTSGGGPNVGIYVDGFYNPNPAAGAFDLTNVTGIQVLKGPQGTLFGRNTTGGAILVTSADPSETTKLMAKASYGRFNTQKYSGYVTTGLMPGVAMDVEGQIRQGDGYITDITTNNHKAAAYQNWTVRGGLKVNLGSSTSVLFRYTHANTDDPTQLMASTLVQNGITYAHDQIPTAAQIATQPRTTALATNEPTTFTGKNDQYQGTIKSDLGFAELTSYTQLRQDTEDNYYNLDFTAAALYNIYIGIRNKTFSQEFLLNSKAGSKLQWTLGAYYFYNRDTYLVEAAFLGAPRVGFGGSSTNTQSLAAFADATYEVMPKTFIDLGLRYSHERAFDGYFKTYPGQSSYTDIDGNSVAIAVPAGTQYNVTPLTNNKVTPRVVLRYKPSDESSIYASYTQGYKGGVLDVGSASFQHIAPENIDAFEVGYKYADHRFTADLAAFYYNYRNLQVSQYLQGTANIRNAASSHIWGLEADFSYKFDSHFDVHANAAYTHARYASFPDAPTYNYMGHGPTLASYLLSMYPGTTNANGFAMQRAPDFTANLNATYRTELAGGKLTASTNVYYTSKFYFDPSQQFAQSAYATASARVQWVDPSQHYTLAVYGDNLTNHTYKTAVQYNLFSAAANWSSPITYGVELGVKFW